MRLQKLINGTYEEEIALINVDTNEVIVKGDWYHDKVTEHIDGFLHSLRYVGVKYEILDEKDVFPDDELFELCDFYNDED